MSGVALGGAAVLGAVLLVMLLLQLRTLLAVLFLGVIVGLALSPVAEQLNRWRVPKVLAVLAVYGVIATLLGLFVWYAAIELTDEFSELEDRIEELRADYDDWAEERGWPISDDAGEFLSDNGSGVANNAVSQAFNIAGSLFYVFTIFFVGLLFTVSKDRMRALALSLLEPHQRERTEELLDKLGHRLRRYVVAELATMFAVGGLTYAGLTLLGIRFPLILATIAFLLELLPTIGPWLAYVPALAVALTQGWEEAIKVSALYLGIQAAENYLIVPVVHGREAQMPALLIIVAILVGGALMGILGALIALPVAVILQTLFLDVVVPWRKRKVEEAERRRQPKLVASGE
jgi:predicted PurR-regulated permease PerM